MARNADGLAGLLTRRGYKLLCAENADAAAGLCSAHPGIAVIVIDLGREGMAAFEGSRVPECDGAEYLLVTDHDGPLAAIQALKPDGSEILPRPVTDAQIADAVSDAYNVARLKRFRREEARSLEALIGELQGQIQAAFSGLLEQARRNGMLPAGAPDTPAPARALLHAFLVEEARRARQRERIFGPIVANQGAWLLLLALSDAALIGRELTIKAAAYSAGMPLSSALRKINAMCSAGLAKRHGDPADARRSIVALTGKGRSCFEQYCSAAASG